MDIERVNGVLVKAIMGFQDDEIEAMAEATAGGYKVPSPSEVAAKAKKGGKKCSHRNKAGDFPNYNACVAHMDKCEGHADPKGICGGIMFGKKKKKKKADDEEE
jgi:hypothetical protein